MRNVKIEVFPISKTTVDRAAVRRWLDYLKFQEYEIPEEGTISDPALLVAMAAKRCYLSFEANGVNPNITQVRKDLVDYLDNVLKSGHGSVFEHSVYTFAVEGVSRVFTGEMNRHRAGVAISEGSMRYIRFNDLPFWMPNSITVTKEEEAAMTAVNEFLLLPVTEQDNHVKPTDEEYKLAKRAKKKMLTQAEFKDHFLMTEARYSRLTEIWKDDLSSDVKGKEAFHLKKQLTSMMRRIVPMGVATGGVWTLNMRALRHILALRATPEAEEEICYVAGQMLKIMAEQEPAIFGDFSELPGWYYVPKYRKV